MRKGGKISRKKSFFVLIIFMFTALWGICVYQINRQIPQVKKTIFTSGDWVLWKDGVEIKVNGMRFTEDEEIRSAGRISEDALYPCEMRLLWAAVHVRNTREQETFVDLLDLGAESSGWSNIPDVEFYQNFYGMQKTLQYKIQPGEEIIYELPYLLLKANFRDNEWEKVEEKKYYITWSLYPEKKSMILPKK